jgi:hypothetical protein
MKQVSKFPEWRKSDEFGKTDKIGTTTDDVFFEMIKFGE